MRYMTLTDMLDELRAEAGISQNVSHGVTQINPHKALLRRVQEELYLSFDWPHLQTSAVVDVDAGTRFDAYPENFVFEGVKEVWCKDLDTAGARWLPVEYGIGSDELNAIDSDEDERKYPTARWQNYVNGEDDETNQNMYEVWPVVDRNVRFRFVGRRALFPLIDGEDKSTIDAPTIILHAAAEILAKQKSEDASLKLGKAQERRRLLGIRQSASNNARTNLASTGSPRSGLRRGIDYIE